MRIRTALPFAVVALLTSSQAGLAQLGTPQPPPPPQPAKDVEPFDPTGYWVSIVTEDWRIRMATPQIGDHVGVPLTPAATKAADNWDPQADIKAGLACKSFGIGRIMREPTRLHITWDGKDKLNIDTDAGEQHRVLRFRKEAMAPMGKPSWQGFSKAHWEFYGGGPGRKPESGTLMVDTTNMLPGYLRKNGVPYSSKAKVHEAIDYITNPDGTEYLIVKTTVTDPENLIGPYITSSNFRRQKNKDGWEPKPCHIDLPPPGKPAGFG